MKRIAPACLLLLAGCTSAPVADLMDWLSPGRLDPAPGYHGGVGLQQPTPPPPPVPPPADSPLPPPVPQTELPPTP